MSFSALNWAWDQKCPSGVAKSVLVYLANCASQEGGDCYPSVPTIARKVQHKEDTVRKALKALAAANLLEIEQRRLPNRRQTSNRYRLPVVSIATPPKSGGQVNGAIVPDADEWTPSWVSPPVSAPIPPPPSWGASPALTPPEAGVPSPPIAGANTLLETVSKKKATPKRADLFAASHPQAGAAQASLREKQPKPRREINGFYVEPVCDAVADVIDRKLKASEVAQVCAWLRDKIESDVIITAIQRRLRTLPGRMDGIRSLKYFDGPVRSFDLTPSWSNGHAYRERPPVSRYADPL
jgi:hypothetical protein